MLMNDEWTAIHHANMCLLWLQKSSFENEQQTKLLCNIKILLLRNSVRKSIQTELAIDTMQYNDRQTDDEFSFVMCCFCFWLGQDKTTAPLQMMDINLH